MTLHAEEEMTEDDLSIFDLETAVLTGKVIDRQRDRHTRESKYLVRGLSMDGNTRLVVVTRFGHTNRLVILTVYAE